MRTDGRGKHNSIFSCGAFCFAKYKSHRRENKQRSKRRIPPQTPPPPLATSEFKKISRVFCEILSPKNSFRKTESALAPPPARILGGQNTKEKCPFLFRRNWSRANPRSKEHFSLVSAEALRGGGGADSFVQFPLEKGSRIFKQRAPSKNRLWPVF